MMDDPSFVIYRHAFKGIGTQHGEEEGHYGVQPAEFYADTLFLDLIDRNILGIQGEVALILHVWMAISHELNAVWIHCDSKYNPVETLTSLDRAVALWVGERDETSNGGHLLYHLAELAGNFFQKETEKNWVNTQIMKSFSSIQSKISTGALCSEAANRTGLHAEIDRIHSLMMVPLLQNLIHYVMAGEKKELAKIYLAAVLPHVLACDPNMAMELDLVGTIGSLNDTQKIAWVRSLHKAFSCMRLACDDIGAYTQDPNYPDCRDDLTANFTSHVASNPKSELYSRIDRDLQRLQILLNEGAYKSALTLYVHGYHAPFSLQKLAANDVIPRPVGPLVDLYKYVYGNDDDDPKYFADQEVQRAINREGEFRSLPDEELTDLVLGLLTYEVSFFAVMSSFDISQEMCEDNGSNTTALEYWDNGAALYVGSIEGSNKGGKIGGQLLYGVSKTLCSLFKTCFEGNSRANHLMIQSLALGAEYLAEGKCTALGNLIEDFIYPALQTIVIQGTLASVATVSSSEGTRSNVTGLGSVHAFARSLLPQLREARKEIAPQVEQKLLLPYSEALSMSAIYDVAEVLYLAMPDLATDCESVGTMKSPSLTLCQTIRLQNPINDISFGRYLFLDTDIVDHLAAIALDIRDMRNATSIEQAIEIYQQGRHALQDSRGRITLASFSTNATVWMADDPIFNMYKFALYDKSALASRDVPFPFADDFVQKTTDLKLIPDAAVVLNVWMMISHHLSQVWRTCADKKDATKEVDAAVALWIGNDQVEGSYETGWLVYSVVQDASRTFGHPEKEAKLNENLMKGFNHLQRISQECVDNDNTTTLLQDLRYHLFEVQRLLTIPLLQLLLSAIAEKDSSRVELFATSVIPLSVGCNRKIYSDLSQRLLRDFQAWNDEGISDLKVFLECLDVSCEELNVTTTASESLQDLMEKFCAAKGPHNEVSADPLFKAVSRIDLDILQIEILLRTEANGAAMDLYNYGRNTNILNLDLPGQMEGSSFLSLHHLATLSANTSLLKEFEEYYGSTNYADELVTELIQQEGLYQNATSSLLAADNSALQLLILFQGILWNLQEAVTSCEKGQMTSAIKGWLVAMGIFNGSTSDSSVHSLGSQICAGFGTCTDDGDSLSNQVILGALQQGYVSLKANECLLAQELMDSTIIPLLKVPLIQATLERSVVHEDTVTNATEERHASGFAVTQAILPFLANVNTDSAEVIANIFRSPSDIASSWEETDLVFKAIQYVLPAMGIECSYLGSWVDEPSLSFCFDLNLTDWIIPHSDLGLDVRDMRAALRSGEVELARMIYNDGKNGKVGNHTLSLRSLSTEATMEMAGVPLFELFLHTHSGSQRYADSFVQEAFKLAGSTNTEVARSAVVASTIAAEATIVLHLWMAVIYQMHRAVLACENSGSLNDIAEAIDRTTAYYIGDAQPNNEAEPGHLLYGWTQEMSSHFASVGENVLGVNEYILILFAEAHEMIGGLSTSNSRGAFELNALFHEATLQMTIPLVQGLLHALMMDDRERVRLYSHAVVPLFSSCDRGDYEYFQRTLMDTSFVATEIQAIVDRVYQLLPCLGLTCSQVGLHQLDMAASYTRPFCSEDSLKKSYHGYQPSNDKVFEDVSSGDGMVDTSKLYFSRTASFSLDESTKICGKLVFS